VLATTVWGNSASWTLAALPLFIWMGEILFRTKLSEEMFRGLAPWLNRIPGRLMHVNVLACGIFGSVSGSSAATTATVAKIGRVLPPVSAPPVGANDIARWAVATYWPERPPAEFLDPAVAEKGPWGGIVAPRDFDPFAWMPDRPWSGDWLYGMGTEPGTRVLNGGQHNRYGAPIRPGDVISVTRRFVDVVEHQTKRGPMVFFTSEMRWENQDGELVRVGEQTTIYY